MQKEYARGIINIGVKAAYSPKNLTAMTKLQKGQVGKKFLAKTKADMEAKLPANPNLVIS